MHSWPASGAVMEGLLGTDSVWVSAKGGAGRN